MPVAVIAAPFNCYTGTTPDASNVAIARVAEAYMRRYALPFYGQREHTGLLGERGLSPIYAFVSKDGEWVQTHRLLRWISTEVQAREHNHSVVLVGHPDHVRRVALLARYYGLSPLVAPECCDVPYDPGLHPGYQWWCRTRLRYLCWEFLLARPALLLQSLLGRL